MSLPDHVERAIRRNPNHIPLRLEFFSPPEVKWRAVPNVEHSTLCAAFGLDPASFWFDMPESFRREGSQRAGLSRTRREISGFVFRGPRGTDPVAKLFLARESDRFRDRDPLSRSDFERLGETL